MVVICHCAYPLTNEEKYKQHFDTFSYPLSDFQKYAIEAIVEGHHVLVTAPTGSGKTLPSEFGIEYFVNKGKKVVYCSPIKALSNQKYYDFSKKYPHISFGLYTGDIRTNPEADVLIMTTEILMNSLFRKDNVTNGIDFKIDIENELACVVFDEVHYINDLERGQNWEKTIMMLPYSVQMIMLSATIDNPSGFAQWIETISSSKQNVAEEEPKQTYLAYTNHRIVPLTHYGFLTTNETIFKGMKDKELEKYLRDNTNKLLLLQTAKNSFNDNNYNNITKILKTFDNKQVFMKRKAVLNTVSLFMRDHDMLPAIAFVFSRKHVELCASEITVPLLEDDSKIPYTVRRECESIIRKLPNFQEYLELPEYQQVVGLLEKGIGIHHSGMIPVLREIVELMISKKYIKILFATESFAIGLDCPIRTALFTSLTKFDGNNERYLLSHEYTQMAGRAGRRGIDTIGNVIHLNNLFQTPSVSEYKNILCGKPQQLTSKFNISYSLILNLLKNGQTNDFHHFSEKSMVQNELTKMIDAQNRIILDLVDKLERKKSSLTTFRTPVDTCYEYIRLKSLIKTLTNKKRKDAERDMRNIEETYKTLETDVSSLNEYILLNNQLIDETIKKQYSEDYIKEQTDKCCNLLLENGYIERLDDCDNYKFTNLGDNASSIAEIHPLVITKFMDTCNYFEEFSTKQLIGLFSCFTNIKVPTEQRINVPNTIDLFLKNKINIVKDLYLFYDNLETTRNIRSGLNYDNALQYDIIDFSMQWCDCNTEHECKYFIQTFVSDRGISIGDFNKALLKITAIVKEIMNVAENNQHLDLLYKLSQIEGMILKYVATSQSLYV